ncbi:MAG: TonB-dependent receptor [Bacteroidales bacterium]|nr:TonB-dependent receptor [Bacteroidales bacterium]
MKPLLFIFIALLSGQLNAQTIIRGTVNDESNNPLTGANIYIKGTYTGATSDTIGRFSITTLMQDTCILIIAYIGYETIEKEIALNQRIINLDFRLNESVSELDRVIITAGTFEAGDKKRSVLLSSLDIVTTANAEGDIYGALNMLPGAQTEGETGKIIVRGGESHEMKTFMDGMLISTPYTSRMPDIPARGRFSPFLFSGVMFSTGGYSAEFGQALSSVLELNTEALAEESLTSVSLLNVGAGLGYTHRFDNSSVTIEADYSNLTPFFAMTRHNLDWEKVPEGFSGQIRYRKKTGDEGMIKSFVSYSNSSSRLNYPNYDTGMKDKIGLGDENLFQTTTYNTKLGEKWILKTGLAFNISRENFDINTDRMSDKLNSCHAKASFNNYTSKNLTMKFGIESFHHQNRKSYHHSETARNYLSDYSDHLTAGYAESDIRLHKSFAARIGVRTEYSTYLKRASLAPRISLAYQISKTNQLSFAFGSFYQNAENDFLLVTDSLSFEHAMHYIFNYQYSKNNRLFRIEAYHKQYDNLVKYRYMDQEGYQSVNNNGYGYARGIDIFWRDKETFTMADYWISYSFIDSKRKYRDFPVIATPYFVSGHNLSVVYKYWFPRLSTQLSGSYKFRSGRPYFNPNHDNFMSDRTRAFNDISLAVSYLTSLFGNFTIVYVSCNNVFGFDNTFGYHFETEPDDTGTYLAHPVQPYAKRTFIIGIFISIE